MKYRFYSGMKNYPQVLDWYKFQLSIKSNHTKIKHNLETLTVAKKNAHNKLRQLLILF